MSSLSQPEATRLDLPQEIWLDVFRYATYIVRATTIAALDPFVPESVPTNALGANTFVLSMRTKVAIVQVCKAWRRIATELLYEYFSIRSPRIASLMLRSLRDSRNADGRADLGRWVRHIEVYTHARGSSLSFLQDVFQISTLCPNVRMFSGMWTRPLPRTFLTAITRMYGDSLKGLYWKSTASSPTDDEAFSLSEFMASFRALRVLDLRYQSTGPQPRLDTHLACSKPTIVGLEELQVSSYQSSLCLAVCFDLPSLKRVLFEVVKSVTYTARDLKEFIETHGKNIVHLQMVSATDSIIPINLGIFLGPMACPHLEELVFHQNEPRIQMPEGPHSTLRHIGLRGVTIDRLFPDKHTHLQQHLEMFTPENFPQLQSVRALGFLAAHALEPLALDVFIWWAEQFERDGIDFRDGAGILWLPAEEEEPKPDGPRGYSWNDARRKALRHSRLEPGHDNRYDSQDKPD